MLVVVGHALISIWVSYFDGWRLKTTQGALILSGTIPLGPEPRSTQKVSVKADLRLVGDQIRSTGYFFAGLIFWSGCFSMSRLAGRLERRLSLGRAATLARMR